MLRHFSPDLFADAPVLGAQATTLADRTYERSAFLTGPSRTGDIEPKVTVGVRGPGELYLVLIDEPSTG
jgi:L-lactate utilization protein LutC